MEDLSAQYWDKRYLNDDATWDLGGPSAPLKAYIDQLTDKNARILIPGAGNAYEAEYLHRLGFTEVYVLDISEIAFRNIRERIPSFPPEHLLLEDFFSHRGQYDLILEQTFFCALNPALRKSYVSKMGELLKPGGTLAGVLFDDTLNHDKPPFGGTRQEYETLFFPAFTAKVFASCYNSIKPRAGRELFMILKSNP